MSLFDQSVTRLPNGQSTGVFDKYEPHAALYLLERCDYNSLFDDLILRLLYHWSNLAFFAASCSIPWGAEDVQQSWAQDAHGNPSTLSTLRDLVLWHGCTEWAHSTGAWTLLYLFYTWPRLDICQCWGLASTYEVYFIDAEVLHMKHYIIQWQDIFNAKVCTLQCQTLMENCDLNPISCCQTVFLKYWNSFISLLELNSIMCVTKQWVNCSQFSCWQALRQFAAFRQSPVILIYVAIKSRLVHLF